MQLASLLWGSNSAWCICFCSCLPVCLLSWATECLKWWLFLFFLIYSNLRGEPVLHQSLWNFLHYSENNWKGHCKIRYTVKTICLHFSQICTWNWCWKCKSVFWYQLNLTKPFFYPWISILPSQCSLLCPKYIPILLLFIEMCGLPFIFRKSPERSVT